MEATTIERYASDVPKESLSDKKAKELREAVDRVYQRYGTDLSAFQRDVQKELEKRAR